jgi:hypothetical protein
LSNVTEIGDSPRKREEAKQKRDAELTAIITACDASLIAVGLPGYTEAALLIGKLMHGYNSVPIDEGRDFGQRFSDAIGPIFGD